MKYRIQENYKQTDEIPNTGALQTNRVENYAHHIYLQNVTDHNSKWLLHVLASLVISWPLSERAL